MKKPTSALILIIGKLTLILKLKQNSILKLMASLVLILINILALILVLANIQIKIQILTLKMIHFRILKLIKRLEEIRLIAVILIIAKKLQSVDTDGGISNVAISCIAITCMI